MTILINNFSYNFMPVPRGFMCSAPEIGDEHCLPRLKTNS